MKKSAGKQEGNKRVNGQYLSCVIIDKCISFSSSLVCDSNPVKETQNEQSICVMVAQISLTFKLSHWKQDVKPLTSS